jgi:hypothetical protein
MRTFKEHRLPSHGVRRPTIKNVARDPFCSLLLSREAIGKKGFLLGGRTRARTWDPLIKRQMNPLKTNANFPNQAKAAALGFKGLHAKFKPWESNERAIWRACCDRVSRLDFERQFDLRAIGLHLSLAVRGDKVPVTLEFEKAGRVTISLDVEAVGAQGPAGGSRLKYGRQDADEEDARSIRHENVRTRRPNRLHQ